ncbi:MAG: dihydrolipoyl dehydrogenase family protein [Acidimicrobiia bacterium]
MENADVIVIGTGPGGEWLAGELAEAGLDVVAVERHLVGGECPYWGCVPTKMMVRAAHLLEEGRRIPGMAGEAEVRPDWDPVAARIRADATADWDDTVAVERLEGHGGRLVRGTGRLEAPGVVSVGDRRIRAGRAIVLATGTSPDIPAIAGLADTPYWTNHEAVAAETLPRSLIVLGGGAVGAELTQVFSRFGVEVTVVDEADRLLSQEEPEAGEIVAAVFAGEGIEVITGNGADRIDHDGSLFSVTLATGRNLSAERLLVATGRRLGLTDLGLEVLGIDPAVDAVPVDEHLRVADGVWAVGDITGKGAFTHVSMYQAAIAAADILGRSHAPADYSAVPRVTFTDPEVASVGLTEAAANDEGIEVTVGSTPVPTTARGWMHKAGNDGVIKLVADRGRDVLIGATAVGPNGGEVIGLLTLAVKAATPLDLLRTMIYAYPTFHRGIEDALRHIPRR